MGARRFRASALFAMLLFAVVAGTGWASLSYTFTTADGWADWGQLKLEVDSSGNFKTPTFADSTGVTCTWEDYSTTGDLPSGVTPKDRERFDIEGLFYKRTSGYHNFLVVLSADPTYWKTYSQQAFWRGDLAINPTLGVDGRPTWTDGGPNISGLGVKTGGAHQGYARVNADWGYQAGAATGPTLADLEWHDPYRNTGDNNRGFNPGEYENFSWGSNFYHTSGDAVGAGDVSFFELAGPVITGGDGLPEWGLSTYAYQVSVSDDLMASIGGFQSASVAGSCLNDSTFLRAPEPASLVLLGCAAGAGVLVRRRKKR